jgi:hypothetical protein
MEYELYHYGVKGMKWGVHKAVEYDWSDKPSKAKVEGSDYKKRMFNTNNSAPWNLKELRNARYSTKEFKDKYGMTREEVEKKQYKAAVKALRSGKDSFVDAVNKKHLSMKQFEAKRVTKEGRAEVEKILQDLDDVVLKEIGYKDLELGRRMLYEYNLDVKVNDIVW